VRRRHRHKREDPDCVYGIPDKCGWEDTEELALKESPEVPALRRNRTMTTTPALDDAERAIRGARAHLDYAAGSDDAAVQRDRYRQAGVLLGHAARLLADLAEDPSPPPSGLPLSFGAPAGQQPVRRGPA
jgi:hypothetical protein